MKLARRGLEEPQIGLAPLIDVVFLLLLFFMVTTSFVRDASIALRLPGAGVAASETAALPEVVVAAGDRFYVGGEPVAGRRALQAALSTLAAGADAGALRIRADGRASHQAVVTVMELAAAAGFERIDIATRTLGPQPERP